jgi:hypothetical protein
MGSMDTSVATDSKEPIPITEAEEKRAPARLYRDLPARPIMIYPQSNDQRQLFEAAAAAEKRKLSPFIIWAVSEYIRMRGLAETPEGRLEIARKRLSEKTA